MSTYTPKRSRRGLRLVVALALATTAAGGVFVYASSVQRQAAQQQQQIRQEVSVEPTQTPLVSVLVARIDLQPKKISEEETVATYGKKLRKSIEEYEKLNKSAEVAQLKSELAVVEEYLPKKASPQDTDCAGKPGARTKRHMTRARSSRAEPISSRAQSRRSNLGDIALAPSYFPVRIGPRPASVCAGWRAEIVSECTLIR